MSVVAVKVFEPPPVVNGVHLLDANCPVKPLEVNSLVPACEGASKNTTGAAIMDRSSAFLVIELRPVGTPDLWKRGLMEKMAIEASGGLPH